MNRLLIVGVGQYGRLVKEVAEDCGYQQIAFLDDNSEDAIGKVTDYKQFIDSYDEFVVAIGNPEARKRCVEMLKDKYKLTTIIHPLAYVSKEAIIAPGCILEPQVVVYRAVNLGEACIINAGAVINHDSSVGAFSQIGCNAVISARAIVPDGTKVGHCSFFSGQ